MPAPTEFIDGRWQVIGTTRDIIVSAPRKVARGITRVAAPAAVGGAMGGAGAAVCYSTGWPAGLFGSGNSITGADGQGGPGEGGGAAPGTLMTWPNGFPAIQPSMVGPSLLGLSPGAPQFTGGPGGYPGDGKPDIPSDPGLPGNPGGYPGGSEPGIPSVPGGPGSPDHPVKVPEPEVAALFVGFLALFAGVMWISQGRGARRSSTAPATHPAS